MPFLYFWTEVCLERRKRLKASNLLIVPEELWLGAGRRERESVEKVRSLFVERKSKCNDLQNVGVKSWIRSREGSKSYS